MTSTQATQILEAVTRAAEAAAQAAQALRDSNDQSRQQKSGFSEASKVVKCHSSFGNANSVEDQAQWIDFSFAFKQWLFYAEPGHESDFEHVGENLNQVVTYNSSPEGQQTQGHAKRLHAILSGLLQHRPLELLKQVSGSDGLEVWRQQCGI